VGRQLLSEDISPRAPYAETRAIGDAWLRRASAPALVVPSAIVSTERNYVFNPRHPQFKKLRWDAPQPIELDDRLWAVNT
jgi:RES domain-containing protein